MSRLRITVALAAALAALGWLCWPSRHAVPAPGGALRAPSAPSDAVTAALAAPAPAAAPGRHELVEAAPALALESLESPESPADAMGAPEAPPRGRLRITVLDAQRATPLPGRRLELLPAFGRGEVASGTSDPAGVSPMHDLQT